MLRRLTSFSCSPLMIDHSSDGKRHSKYHTEGKMKILMRRIAIIASNEGVVLTPRGPPEVLSTIVYFNGDSYVGEVDGNGLKSGHGILKRTNGNVYDGEFKDDRRHGKGKLTWAAGTMHGGDIYEGEYKEGLMNGKGKLTFTNGDIYEGEFKDGKRHVRGKYTWADGDVYDGEFKDGKRHGQGKFTWADGSVNEGDMYEGEYKNDRKHGRGKLTSADGSVVYDGMWFEGKRDEFGLQTRTANANGEGVDVVFTSDQDHIQCGICYNAFTTADVASTDQTSRDLLPVLGACGHYFCHGCIVRCRFMMGSNGTIGCPKCRKADQFIPGNLIPHRMLIDLLRSARFIDKPSSAEN